VAGVLTVGLAAAGPTAAGRATPQLAFGPPVLLTTDPAVGGYEPAVLADPRGGVWVVAHKSNHGDVVAPDAGSTYGVRGLSWTWWSADGRHFVEPSAAPLGAVPDGGALFYGDENAVDVDDAGHVYAVDTSLTDASITRWSLGPAGTAPHADFFRPVIPAGEAYDDRPWVAAHGNGTVLFVGNTWEQDAYPGDPRQPARGASIVHMSYDGGQTFDPVGQPLDGSGWCRPAADHRPRSRLLYVICTTNSSAVRMVRQDLSQRMLLAFVSADDGRTWQRYPIAGYGADNPNTSNWPSVAVGADGVVYVGYAEQAPSVQPRMLVFRSGNGGRSWQRQVVAWPDSTSVSVVGPAVSGVLPLASLAVSHTGAIGLAIQDEHGMFAAVGRWGHPFAFSRVPTGSAQQSANGDFTQCAFTAAGKLAVTWTAQRVTQVGPGSLSLDTDVYYSQQL
jgi:hypothetical protein